MVKVFAEGVDYSSTPNSDWNALAQDFVLAGKKFAGRYAVYDKSPDGRGITAEEFHALRAAGVDVFLYYEEDTAWMLGGESAGVRAATRALDVIQREGLPVGMPVHYSHDIDPESQHFAAIDDCLAGAASVVGWDRVGAYGGWLLIDHLAGGPVRFLAQTIAWQYQHGIHSSTTLHQYSTGDNRIGGVNCDLVAALQPHYGQASDFMGTKPPVWAAPVSPPLKAGKPYSHFNAEGVLWLELTPRRWKALKTIERRKRASDTAAEVGKPIEKGEVVTFIYSVHMPNGSTWFVSRAGSRCRADAFVPTSS